MEAIKTLYEAIQKRPRPEDVAQLILEIGELSPADRKKVEPAARNSLKRATYAYTSMSQDFTRFCGADKVVARTAEIFTIPYPPSAVECLDVLVVEAFMNRVAKSIDVDPSRDIRGQRLARKERREQGIQHKRAYNRKFRAIRRLQLRIERMVRTGKLYSAMRIAKSAGATRITEELLQRDLPTACFVAYLSARMNLRSTFTNTSQVQAFDTVAVALLEAAKKSPTVCWEAIACVHPEADVLKHLTDEEKGRLLGDWTEILHNLADFLAEIYRENSFDLQNMVVHRGNDSSSWNAAAGAWNKARDHWFAIVYALGLEAIIEQYCPGKVMRLMAADVVQWHSALHPATYVWRDLPFPWDVFTLKRVCTKAEVEAACVRHNVPTKGWITPPPSKRPAAFTPTPELVHGVACSSPFLAATLRRAGWFSGKEASPVDVPVAVLHDSEGFTTGAVDLNSLRSQGGVELP
jgi:hypothetical protein